MASDDSLPGPTEAAERFSSLDVLRGVAVLGILLMNITAFGLLSQAQENPRVDGGAAGLDLLVYEITSVGFAGTMRGLLSLLFGAGTLLLFRRFEEAGRSLDAMRLHLRRMLWLLLFGFVHWSLLLWPGDILFVYALCGVMLIMVIDLPSGAQAALAALLIALGTHSLVQDHAAAQAKHAAWVEAVEASSAGAPPSAEQQLAIRQWHDEQAYSQPTAEMIEDSRNWHSGSYIAAVTGQFSSSASFQLWGIFFWIFADVGPFMLIGMVLLRLGLLQGGASLRTGLIMAVAGLALGIPLGLWELRQVLADDFSRLSILAARRTYLIGRAAMTFGLLGLLLVAIRLGVLPGLQRALAAAGRMALSNYLAQTLICIWLFYDFGPCLGLYGQLARHELMLVVAAIWAVQLAWSQWWLTRFRFGPFEWLWRSLTYGRRQPMRF